MIYDFMFLKLIATYMISIELIAFNLFILKFAEGNNAKGLTIIQMIASCGMIMKVQGLP